MYEYLTLSSTRWVIGVLLGQKLKPTATIEVWGRRQLLNEVLKTWPPVWGHLFGSHQSAPYVAWCRPSADSQAVNVQTPFDCQSHFNYRSNASNWSRSLRITTPGRSNVCAQHFWRDVWPLSHVLSEIHQEFRVDPGVSVPLETNSHHCCDRQTIQRTWWCSLSMNKSKKKN